MTFLFALFYTFAAIRGACNSVCAKAQSNLFVLAPPAQCAHDNPAVFRKNYKTAGIAPLNTKTTYSFANFCLFAFYEFFAEIFAVPAIFHMLRSFLLGGIFQHYLKSS